MKFTPGNSVPFWGEHQVVLWLDPQGVDALKDNEREAFFNDLAQWTRLIGEVWKLLNAWQDQGRLQKSLARCLEKEGIPQESSAEDVILIIGVNVPFYGRRRRDEREVDDYAILCPKWP